jgi:hypothetical protein
MSRASFLLSQKMAFAGAALALALAVAPARAEIWDYSFNKFISSDYSVAGSGQIVSDTRALGVPVFVVAHFTRLTAWINNGGHDGVNCNNHISQCHEALFEDAPWQGLSRDLPITSAEWQSFGNPPGLFLRTTDNFADLFSVSDRELNLGMATPGPIAGTGLPVLAGLLAAWGFLRRRGRAE